MDSDRLGRLIDQHAEALELYARQWTDAAEDVEDDGGRVRIGSVVESDADDVAGTGEVAQRRSEDPGVAIPGAVRSNAGGRETGQRHTDHTETATRPMTV